MKVTVVCPTFNRPWFVRHAAELFMDQTWRDSEMLILDDSEPALRVMDLPKSSRIRHVTLDRLTMGAKHNMAHDLGQGDVFCFWDDDDWFGRRRLVRQLEPIARGQADIVGMPRDYVLDARTMAWYKFGRMKQPVRAWIGNGVGNFSLPLHDGSCMYRREVLKTGATFPETNLNQKVEFINAAVKAGARWKAIPNDKSFVYLRHGTNVWQFKERLRLEKVKRPAWFPEPALEFYRRLSG